MKRASFQIGTQFSGKPAAPLWWQAVAQQVRDTFSAEERQQLKRTAAASFGRRAGGFACQVAA